MSYCVQLMTVTYIKLPLTSGIKLPPPTTTCGKPTELLNEQKLSIRFLQVYANTHRASLIKQEEDRLLSSTIL
jgi:hypothetical protein